MLSPLIARPRPEGNYEIISGHRRQYAAQLAGLDTLPVIVRNMDDDAAVLLMVDSNLQRENILPSERAFAYKMKLEALKNQGARSDLTSRQVGEKLWVEEIDALAPEQRNKIRFADGTEEECRLVCDLMHLEGAEEIAQYESDFYAGMTAVAKNRFGKGTVYYVGTDLSESGLAKVLAMAADGAAIQPVIGEATALEITKRQADGEDLYFIINFKDEEIPLPVVFDGKEDILTGEKVQGGEMLKKYAFWQGAFILQNFVLSVIIKSTTDEQTKGCIERRRDRCISNTAKRKRRI